MLKYTARWQCSWLSTGTEDAQADEVENQVQFGVNWWISNSSMCYLCSTMLIYQYLNKCVHAWSVFPPYCPISALVKIQHMLCACQGHGTFLDVTYVLCSQSFEHTPDVLCVQKGREGWGLRAPLPVLVVLSMFWTLPICSVLKYF